MAKRYYNLKKGKPEVNGVVVEVDLDIGLEKRVKNFIYNTQATLLEYKNKLGLYALDLNEAHSLRPELESMYSLKPRLMVTLAVSDKGDIEIHEKPSNAAIYLEEITLEKAKGKKEGAENWSLLQSWV